MKNKEQIEVRLKELKILRDIELKKCPPGNQGDRSWEIDGEIRSLLWVLETK